jgi:nitroimidazol reductase NimA-like FMN-containing flavoprotein (pyridoxamine 5'-phosphate oxidase superfamily)
MAQHEPTAELDPRFSSPDATPTPWSQAGKRLEFAEIYWLSTVRPDGQPHVTPLISAWLDGAAYFVTGPAERKAKNLEKNQNCVLTTGCDKLGEGLDIVVEGRAARVTDRAKLQHVADAFTAKYPEPFHFKVRDDGFDSDGEKALVFEIKPTKVLGFGKGETYSQTRWRF